MHKKSIGLLLLAGLLTLATPLTLSSCSGRHCSGDGSNSSNNGEDSYKGKAPEALVPGNILKSQFTEELPGIGTTPVSWTITVDTEYKASFTVEKQTPHAGSEVSSPRTGLFHYVKTGPDTGTLVLEKYAVNSEGHDYIHEDTVRLNMIFDTETSGTVPSAHFRIYDSDTGTEPTTYTAGTFELQLQ